MRAITRHQQRCFQPDSFYGCPITWKVRFRSLGLHLEGRRVLFAFGGSFSQNPGRVAAGCSGHSWRNTTKPVGLWYNFHQFLQYSSFRGATIVWWPHYLFRPPRPSNWSCVLVIRCRLWTCAFEASIVRVAVRSAIPILATITQSLGSHMSKCPWLFAASGISLYLLMMLYLIFRTTALFLRVGPKHQPFHIPGCDMFMLTSHQVQVFYKYTSVLFFLCFSKGLT